MKTIESCKRGTEPELNSVSLKRWIGLLIGAITSLIASSFLFFSCT